MHFIQNPRKLIASYSKQDVVLFIDISQVKLSCWVFSHDYVKQLLLLVKFRNQMFDTFLTSFVT